MELEKATASATGEGEESDADGDKGGGGDGGDGGDDRDGDNRSFELYVHGDRGGHQDDNKERLSVYSEQEEEEEEENEMVDGDNTQRRVSRNNSRSIP